jgi:repressor LexA
MQNQISNKELEALQAVRSHLMKYGKMPSVRELMKELNYKSPRSASVVMQKLIDKGILKKKKDGSTQLIQYNIDEIGDIPQEQTVKVPLLGTVTCGLPILAEENIEAELAVSTKVAKQPGKYYLLRTQGDSMNQKGINDRDLVLVKHQNNADNGDIIVALIDDAYFGLVYEAGISTESIFAKLSNLHEKILAVKIDGATKEDYVWGFRVGFFFLGVFLGTGELYKFIL